MRTRVSSLLSLVPLLVLLLVPAVPGAAEASSVIHCRLAAVSEVRLSAVVVSLSLDPLLAEEVGLEDLRQELERAGIEELANASVKASEDARAFVVVTIQHATAPGCNHIALSVVTKLYQPGVDGAYVSSPRGAAGESRDLLAWLDVDTELVLSRDVKGRILSSAEASLRRLGAAMKQAREACNE